MPSLVGITARDVKYNDEDIAAASLSVDAAQEFHGLFTVTQRHYHSQPLFAVDDDEEEEDDDAPLDLGLA